MVYFCLLLAIQDGRLFVAQKATFETLSQLIGYYRGHTLETHFTNIPTHLTSAMGGQGKRASLSF